MSTPEGNLIHMGGRVYDPGIGRFLSPDPHIQDPGNLQSLNRYSYVRNNPLTLTDPSGFFSLGGFLEDIGDWVHDNGRTLAAVAIAAITPYAAPVMREGP